MPAAAPEKESNNLYRKEKRCNPFFEITPSHFLPYLVETMSMDSVRRCGLVGSRRRPVSSRCFRQCSRNSPSESNRNCSMYACIYLDSFEEETDYASRLLCHCKEQNWEICGDYFCEIMTEFNIFDDSRRSMFLRLQVPVRFDK